MIWSVFLVSIAVTTQSVQGDIGARLGYVTANSAGPLKDGAATISVNINWSQPLRTVVTSAQIEIDFMPFLGRTPEGGNFNGYYEALSNLGAEYVRFAPWYGYPKVVVPELAKTKCQGSEWNSTLIDQTMSDFMTAVCGERAAEGECKHSVAQQLSTMPAWLYQGSQPSIPDDPWQYPSGDLSHYSTGPLLVDETCSAMARFAARFVGWYTAGGFTDECGGVHKSGLYYNWTYLSVLNEDEHHMTPEDGVEYTKCFDAWKLEIQKVNRYVTLIGPETYYMTGEPNSLKYNQYFLNASNHADKQSPPIISNHNAVSDFDGFDAWYSAFAEPLDKMVQELAPGTKQVLNEVVLGVKDWCDTGSKKEDCPNWMDSSSQGRLANRKTLSWNHDATVFAYNFARLSDLGYFYVTSDQLVGGPWPDNYPSVSSLDWTTGEPNAKYWAVHMLAAVFGKRPRQLMGTSTSTSDAYARGFVMDGQKGVLLLSKSSDPVTFSGPFSGWEGTVLEGVGDEPGFVPPRAVQMGKESTITVGAYGVAVLWEPHNLETIV